MSLARIAVRFATMKALQGRTIAGDRVRDSEIGPLDELDSDVPSPVITVYTDDASLEVPRRDLLAQRGAHALVIEAAITTRMKNSDRWQIPTTDAGMELSLEVIDREISVALMDPANEWAEIWRRLAQPTGQAERKRGASAKEGVRFAGSQLNLQVELVRDPQPGEPLSELWETFFAKAELEGEFAPIVPLMRALAIGPGAGNTWHQLRAAYGLTALEARALQIMPAADAEAAPAFSGIELSAAAEGDGNNVSEVP